MNKRIAVVMTTQHFIAHGGVGQFVKGFHDLAAQHGCIVDLILDSNPKTNAFFTPNGRIFHPRSLTSLKDHRDVFAFKDSMRLETTTNLRNSLMVALNTVIYDMIVLQSPEALLAGEILGLQSKIPVVFYTHLENIIYPAMKTPTFSPQYLDMTRCLMRMKDLIVGTQSKVNQDALVDLDIHSTVLPMPIPEQDLLIRVDDSKKEGLLFIGRWEERKNPSEFVRVAAKTGLPVKVMTAPNHIEKAKEDLKAAGVTDMDVRGGITGKEKVDFIRSAKINYVPSHRESFCFALFEGLGHCHSIVLEKNDWWGHYRREDLNIAKNTDDAVRMALELYGQPVPDSQMEFVQAYQDTAWKGWSDLLEEERTGRDSKRSEFYKTADGGIYFSDFINRLGRSGLASIEDVAAAYNSFDVTNRVQTSDDTWAYLDPSHSKPDDKLFELI